MINVSPSIHLASSQLLRTNSVSTTYDCASLCVSTPGCTFSVFRAGGLAGSGSPLCQIKSSAFFGIQSPSVTQRQGGGRWRHGREVTQTLPFLTD